MKTFKDLNSLYKHIEKNTKFAIKDVMKEVEKIATDFILQRRYSTSPKSYERTFDYVNSLRVGKVKEEDGHYTVKLYFDTDAIRQHETEDFWNQHMSVDGSKEWNGTPVKDLIPLWMEEGVTSKLYHHDGDFAMQDAYEILDELHLLKKELKKRGFNVEFDKSQ